MTLLDDYKRKREFNKTNEPEGSEEKVNPGLPEAADGRFVVQEHHAQKLHWDVRLEIDGVLKSWAVPKGPPLVKGIRRLAVKVEDHPMEYLEFEGVIPEGNYGAGTVSIWDRGYYTLVDRKPHKLVLVLLGEKLKGGYVLVRTKDNQWLMIKMYNYN